MGEIRKVERSFASKVPVSQMHDIWSTKLPLMSTMCPDIVTSVDLLQGRWGEEGCTVLWNINFQGKAISGKEVMEVIDKKNHRIVYKATEGGPLDYYKSFTWIFQASPDDNVVHWSLEYEKDNEDVPEPTAYLDLLLFATTQVHAHLINAA